MSEVHGSASPAQARIPVGVLVERRKANSPWAEFIHRPVSVLPGIPAAVRGTVITTEAGVTTFYAGDSVVELHRAETAGYRDNLASGTPVLWVVLRPATAGFDVLMVTADPAEGEALTGAGNDLIETVPMPEAISAAVASFIAEHHVERPFFKRRRENAPDQKGRRGGSPDE